MQFRHMEFEASTTLFLYSGTIVAIFLLRVVARKEVGCKGCHDSTLKLLGGSKMFGSVRGLIFPEL